MGKTAQAIENYFGAMYINGPLLHSSFGYRLDGHSKGATERNRSFGSALFWAIQAADWGPELNAVAGVQHLYQVAGRNIRRHVRPLLADEPPAAIQGSEKLFWDSRLAGTQHSYGAAYYLGYRIKAASALRNTMKDLWGKDSYLNNREVFITALNLNSQNHKGGDREIIQDTFRKPALAAIGQGRFNLALTKLQEAYLHDRYMFSPPARSFLQRTIELAIQGQQPTKLAT